MARIHLLPDHLVSQIAAGEVIERPASVVKELVENALDAGATTVEVELERGGKGRIVVTDDGSGMGPDDALLAFDQHATSKIASFEDLERVGTLGFRGEALASIAAVARVELLTALDPEADPERAAKSGSPGVAADPERAAKSGSPGVAADPERAAKSGSTDPEMAAKSGSPDVAAESGSPEVAAESGGHRVRIEGGRVKVAEPAARPPGTTVEVASLFFNVPARRKFLKTPGTELRRCLEVVQGYALARPDVRFTVRHQGRTSLDVLPAGDDPEGLRERVAALFGAELAEELVTIPRRSRRDGETVWGLVGSPATTKRRRIFVFVNRRLLRDRAILATFYRSVRDVWKADDFPALFLFVDVPAEDVDVNVHPQKAEVRFRDTRLVDRLGEVLREALDRARGEEMAPLRSPDAPPATGFAWQGLGGRGGRGGEGAGERYGPLDAAAGASEVREGDAAGGWRSPAARDPASSGFVPGFGAGSGGGPGDGRERRPSAEESRLATTAYAPLDGQGRTTTVPLSGPRGGERPLRILGQYKGALVLLEGPDGLYLVDQHAAHERILYERLRRSLGKERPPSQALLEPQLLELSAPERLRLGELAESLDGAGFGVAALSGDDVAVTAVPAVLEVDEAVALLHELAADDAEGSGDVADLERRILEALAASFSCKRAIKIHHPLVVEEMEALVVELFAAENPYACPHGRPTVLKMGDAELERRFGRR